MAPSEPSLVYRPEIDGLRAVAVAAVVLYHAGTWLPGGYAGVDVFFVISGYLIASIALREVSAGRFRVGRFWERRLRRLFPAWFAAVAATAAGSLVFLIPAHLADFGESLLAQPTLTANFHFWERTGYFEPESGWQPLLHTWSLAVEEQFYLFFPLVVPPLLKRGRKAAAIGVALLAVISFAVCLYASPREPEFAFFLLPARIWELNLGILLALAPLEALERFPRLREVLRTAGLAGMAGAFVLFGPNTPFPGPGALIPCLGTVLVIAASAPGGTSWTRWLAAGPVVWLGKVSYPLYLWHWPCLVFLAYAWIEEPPVWALAASIAGALLLAAITYRWIETPVRERRLLTSRRSLVSVALAGALVIAGAGALFFHTGGLPGRLPGLDDFGINEVKRPKVATIEQWEEKGGPPRLGETSAAEPGLLVWGDSHALALTRLFDELGKRHGVKVTVAAMAGVAPVRHAYPAGQGPDETVHAERVLELVRRERFRTVILVAKWPLYLTGRSDGELDRILRDEELRSDSVEEAVEVFRRRFPETLAALEALDCQVAVMRSVPYQTHSVPEALARLALHRRDPGMLAAPASAHRERDRRVNDLLDEVLGGSGAVVLDPLSSLTDEAGFCPFAEDGMALYVDRDHLSPYGSLKLAPLFEPLFRSAGGK